jgi:hypothetical protein
MRISSSFLWKYSSGLLCISECFEVPLQFIWLHTVSCWNTETRYTLRSFFTANYNTRENEKQIWLIVLTRFLFRYTVELRQLFTAGSSSGFIFIPVKNLCIILWFRKHHLSLLALDTGLLTIPHSK